MIPNYFFFSFQIFNVPWKNQNFSLILFPHCQFFVYVLPIFITFGIWFTEYHPDLGIECDPYFEKQIVPSHWRGIHFKDAKFNRPAIHHNTLYVRKSLSQLIHVDIKYLLLFWTIKNFNTINTISLYINWHAFLCCSYAGSGRDYQVNSAVQVEGVPPLINSCVISFSAYNGINVTDPQAPVTLMNTTLTNNRGNGKPWFVLDSKCF